MAIEKVLGIETEYGILARGADINAVAASSLLINAYVNATARQVGWDFQDETPANDARGDELDDFFAPEIETNLVNAVLPNGARYYVDHAHPEVSTPECRTPLEVVKWDRAADRIVQRSMDYARPHLGGGELVVHKNNSDGKGNSYGCHENYLVDRALPFGRLASQITPHFVTRQLFCGAGKVGSEFADHEPAEVPYQLSQRADFFEEPIGLETTLKRPIVNTRDEPHCNPEKYRRLHVIIGDANMSEVATYLKVGTTAIVLAMIEDGVLGDEFQLATPVRALRRISHDPTLRTAVRLANGSTATALDIQWGILERARKYERSHGLAAIDAAIGADVIDRWERVLGQLEADPATAADTVDWVAKRRLVDGYRTRHDLPPYHGRLKAIDLQYHDLRAGKCLAERAGLQTLIDPADIDEAVLQPPTTTRAYFRGRCLQRFADQVVAANWDSMVFDTGTDPLRRVPMMEPLRGTAEHVAKLIDNSRTATELVDRLGS